MKKLFDVETFYKKKTYKETVQAETAQEAFNIISEKYNKERLISIRERKTP
jgi:hypothetical protein